MKNTVIVYYELPNVRGLFKESGQRSFYNAGDAKIYIETLKNLCAKITIFNSELLDKNSEII